MQLQQSVRTVGYGWGDAPWAMRYYEDAEGNTGFFWDAGGHFRQLFEQLNLARVIELACGHGRHAAIVAPRSGRLVLMDIHEQNIDTCRRRLSHHTHVEFSIGSGHDFHPLSDGWATAIYCYDAMVHFSPDIVAAYLRDTARVLEVGGHALYHHSNFPAPLDRHYGDNPHARNHMTAARFAKLAKAAGLTVIEQRVMDWGGAKDLDCLTLLRKDKRWWRRLLG